MNREAIDEQDAANVAHEAVRDVAAETERSLLALSRRDSEVVDRVASVWRPRRYISLNIYTVILLNYPLTMRLIINYN